MIRVVLVKPDAKLREGSASLARWKTARQILINGEPVPVQHILRLGVQVTDIRWWLEKGFIETEDGRPLPSMRGSFRW